MASPVEDGDEFYHKLKRTYDLESLFCFTFSVLDHLSCAFEPEASEFHDSSAHTSANQPLLSFKGHAGPRAPCLANALKPFGLTKTL